MPFYVNGKYRRGGGLNVNHKYQLTLREFGNADEDQVTVKHHLVLDNENLCHSFNLHVDESRVLIEFSVVTPESDEHPEFINRFVHVLSTNSFDRLRTIDIGEFKVPSYDAWSWYANGVFITLLEWIVIDDGVCFK